MPTAQNRTAAGPTPRQAKLITDLLAEIRALGAEHAEVADSFVAHHDAHGVGNARNTIDMLFAYKRAHAAPRATAAPPVAPVDGLVADRLYRIGDDIFRTVASKGTEGRMYAKVLNTETRKWDYAPGAIGRIRPEHRMSVEDAEAVSAKWAWCIRCGIELEAEKSVARGIGPVCIKKI
jgi:hypothetical protein